MIHTMFYNAQGGFQTAPSVDLNAQELANTLTGSASGAYTSDLWDKRVFSDLGNNLIQSNEYNTPKLRAVHQLASQEIPANTEMWLRVLMATKNSSFGNRSCGSFIVITDAAGVAMLSIGAEADSPGLYAKIHNASGSVIQELFPSGVLPTSSFPVDTANKRMSLDFRIKLHELAGFIQVYGYSGVLLKEWVGPTINTEAGSRVPTFAKLYISSGGGSDNNLHEFSILADESTQNMFVMPMFAAGDGSHNAQASGTFTDLGKRLANIKATGGVTINLTGAEKKKFTVLGQSPSTVGLPANYIVKAIAVGATAEAIKADGEAVPFSFMLKPASTVDFNIRPVLAVSPNLNASAMRRAQSRFSLYNTNPITGVAWTVTDLENLEFGVEVGG